MGKVQTRCTNTDLTEDAASTPQVHGIAVRRKKMTNIKRRRILLVITLIAVAAVALAFKYGQADVYDENEINEELCYKIIDEESDDTGVSIIGIQKMTDIVSGYYREPIVCVYLSENNAPGYIEFWKNYPNDREDDKYGYVGMHRLRKYADNIYVSGGNSFIAVSENPDAAQLVCSAEGGYTQKFEISSIPAMVTIDADTLNVSQDSTSFTWSYKFIDKNGNEITA